MSVIRKLEHKDTVLHCCDFNDVCEEEVTHSITNDNGTDKKFYCTEHVNQLREVIFKK